MIIEVKDTPSSMYHLKLFSFSFQKKIGLCIFSQLLLGGDPEFLLKKQTNKQTQTSTTKASEMLEH